MAVKRDMELVREILLQVSRREDARPFRMLKSVGGTVPSERAMRQAGPDE